MASDDAVAGLWFLPGEARSIAALLTIDGDGIASVASREDGTSLASLHRARIVVSSRVGAIARRIEFPGTGLFETADNDGVDRLLRRSGGRGAFIYRLERFHPRLIAFVALAALLCVGLYRYALPAMVEVAVMATPPAVPALLSRGALASLDESILSPTGLEDARRRALTEGFAEMTALTPRGAGGYSLNFRKGGAIGPNAFALPDGTIVLTDELVALAGADDEAIFGVLAHEIGHVERDHSLRRLYQAAGVVALVMLIGGDIGSGAEEVLVQGSALLSLSYSRDQERDADRYSVDMMRKVGRDPAAIIRFFELLQEKFGGGGETDFLSTHPATPARIEEIRRYAAEAAKGP